MSSILPRKKTKYNHIIFLAKNYVGLKNLYKIITKSNLEYFSRKPGVPRSVIEEFREGIIVGSACEQGEVYRAILDGKSDDEVLEIDLVLRLPGDTAQR